MTVAISNAEDEYGRRQTKDSSETKLQLSEDRATKKQARETGDLRAKNTVQHIRNGNWMKYIIR